MYRPSMRKLNMDINNDPPALDLATVALMEAEKIVA
jgi:hypothetical protein